MKSKGKEVYDLFPVGLLGVGKRCIPSKIGVTQGRYNHLGTGHGPGLWPLQAWEEAGCLIWAEGSSCSSILKLFRERHPEFTPTFKRTNGLQLAYP